MRDDAPRFEMDSVILNSPSLRVSSYYPEIQITGRSASPLKELQIHHMHDIYRKLYTTLAPFVYKLDEAFIRATSCNNGNTTYNSSYATVAMRETILCAFIWDLFPNVSLQSGGILAICLLHRKLLT